MRRKSWVLLVIPAEAGNKLARHSRASGKLNGSSFPRRRESRSFLVLIFRAELSLVLRPSELLLAVPKSKQKARRRARCFDSHPANQNPLRFSLAPPSRQHVRVLALGDRDPSRSPHPSGLGLFRHELRCSAPRTAPLIHESVHPWTMSRQMHC